MSGAGGGLLDGRRAVVSGSAGALGGAVAAALARAGARVATLADRTEGTGPGVATARADLGDRASVAGAFAELTCVLGGLDIYVHAAPGTVTPSPAPLATLDDPAFAIAWERPTLAALWCLQGAHAGFGPRGGRVVVVVPTLGMSGGPGLAPAAASAEAQRLLAKSAARQWGEAGVTVNCVAVEPGTFFGAPLPIGTTSLAAPALPGRADAASVAELVVTIAADGSGALTGATLCADGGVWMAP